MQVKRDPSALIWGVLLVVLGTLFLFRSLGVLESVLLAAIVGVFALVGAGFLYLFVSQRERWWAVIPGMGCLGIALLIVLAEWAPSMEDVLGAPIFLGALAVSFVIVYLRRPDSWWAIIPGGTMLSLALVAGIDALRIDFPTGALFLLGLGITFLVLSFVKTPRGRLKWALIPGASLALLGLLVGAEEAAVLGYLWPVLPVLGGAWFVIRGLVVRRPE